MRYCWDSVRCHTIICIQKKNEGDEGVQAVLSGGPFEGAIEDLKDRSKELEES